MTKDRYDIKNAILHFARKYGKEAEYKAMIGSTKVLMSTAVMVIIQELFLQQFSPALLPKYDEKLSKESDLDLEAYAVIYIYTLNLSQLGRTISEGDVDVFMSEYMQQAVAKFWQKYYADRGIE